MRDHKNIAKPINLRWVPMDLNPVFFKDQIMPFQKTNGMPDKYIPVADCLSACHIHSALFNELRLNISNLRLLI